MMMLVMSFGHERGVGSVKETGIFEKFLKMFPSNSNDVNDSNRLGF